MRASTQVFSLGPWPSRRYGQTFGPSLELAMPVLRNATLLTLAISLVTGLVFGLAPELDLAAANLFWRQGAGFIGQTPTGEMLRSIFYAAPLFLAACAVFGWLLRLVGFKRVWTPSGRATLYLLLSLTLGPGLLVNVVLKEHSHRPRPIQTQDLGGQWEFRPWYRFDGQCQRNCSFVSGEAASAFWTLAPALLTPAPIRALSIAAALTFGVATSALRMAFGGHYLSDTLWAGLFTILIVLGLYRLFWPQKTKESDLRDTGAAL